ncbi:sulfotransferase 1C1-like [Gastrophryne carolinensis]
MQRKLTTIEGVAIPYDVARNWEQIYNFQARPDDVLIDTYPKSGTTWMQEIVDLIVHDGDEQICRRAPIYERIPYFELCHLMKPDMDYVNALPSPRYLKSHMPIQLLPPSFLNQNCKIIYVARNAKDTLTSFYHFAHILQFHPWPEPFTEYVQNFMRGNVGWGSWYDHVRGFWEAKDKYNILFLFFEDLKMNRAREVRRVAQFLGKEISDELVEKIVHLTSFEYMKNNPMANYSDFPNNILDQSNQNFMRKGER